MDAKKIETLVEEQLAPIRKELSAMDEENKLLNKDVERLTKENETLTSKMEETLTLSEKLREQNKKLIRETRFISERAKKLVVDEKKKFQEDKEKFIDETSSQIESHINVVTESAFRHARDIFEQDIAVVETDVMTEMARILAPYLGNHALPAKLEKMKKSADIAISEAKKAVDGMKARTDLLEKKLFDSYKQLKEAQLTNYKEKLVNKLPSHLQETAKTELAKSKDAESCRRVYMRVLREGNRQTTPNKPEVAVKEKKTAPKSEVIRESKQNVNVPSVENFDEAPAPPEYLLHLGQK